SARNRCQPGSGFSSGSAFGPFAASSSAARAAVSPTAGSTPSAAVTSAGERAYQSWLVAVGCPVTGVCSVIAGQSPSPGVALGVSRKAWHGLALLPQLDDLVDGDDRGREEGQGEHHDPLPSAERGGVEQPLK